ncbi:GNAT family N-acetyltransferase [Streptomyces inhibens]|uniref:GNAT family N-acetyltransferase n=1 Tax=Streptomyces inhibens TaxID=2293571 RepID=A0A371PPS2_STRIH|nr:GNAT family N-acetyltransferase [Streptomyces inhibens]
MSSVPPEPAPPCPLRPIRPDEFEAWALAVANSYGEDRTASQLAVERGTSELDRTLGAFDGGVPVGGAALYTRALTVPGAVVPTARVVWVGVAPTHRRRGILTSLMRRQLTDVYAAGREPIAVLNASEAAIYERFGYGVASYQADYLGGTRAMGFRPSMDLGRGTIRLVPPLQRPGRSWRSSTTPPAPWPWAASTGRAPSGTTGCTTRSTRATGRRPALRRAHRARRRGERLRLYRLNGGGHENPDSAVEVGEVGTTTRPAYAALWRYLIDIDVHPWIRHCGAPGEPLLHLLADMRACAPRSPTACGCVWSTSAGRSRRAATRHPWMWSSRPRTRSARGTPGVTGCPPTASTSPASARRTAAQLRMTAAELGAAYLGARRWKHSPWPAHRAGPGHTGPPLTRLPGQPGAVVLSGVLSSGGGSRTCAYVRTLLGVVPPRRCPHVRTVSPRRRKAAGQGCPLVDPAATTGRPRFLGRGAAELPPDGGRPRRTGQARHERSRHE